MSDSEDEEASGSEDSDEENIDIHLYRGGDDELDRFLEILNDDNDDDNDELKVFA